LFFPSFNPMRAFILMWPSLCSFIGHQLPSSCGSFAVFGQLPFPSNMLIISSVLSFPLLSSLGGLTCEERNTVPPSFPPSFPSLLPPFLSFPFSFLWPHNSTDILAANQSSVQRKLAHPVPSFFRHSLLPLPFPPNVLHNLANNQPSSLASAFAQSFDSFRPSKYAG
jgi:hypothetical protein